MSIKFSINKELNGIEIQFSEKPTAEVLSKLKALGFRWNPKKFVWYAINTEERLAYAKSIQKEDSFEQITLFSDIKAEPTPKAEPKEVKAEPKSEPKNATEKPKATKPTKATTKATEKAKNEPKKATEKAEPKKDNNVIEFAKARPDIKVRLALDESATIEDCIAKADKEKAIFKDSDSLYVLDGLIAMCKASENFRNNFMREEKTYEGAFKYFMNLARQGFAHTFNGVAYMDNDLALGFAMDYYNMVD